MLIRVLAENTALEGFQAEHGLSIHLETSGRKALFDLGQGDLFLGNARRLGIDLTAVDLAVISHGHYDHGGGLGHFFRANGRAAVYIRRDAFAPHRSSRPDGTMVDNGLSRTGLPAERLIPTGDHQDLGQGWELFAAVTGREFFPEANRSLMRLENGRIRPDDFSHEQNLIIREDKKLILITGCAHNGIINILNRCRDLTGRTPDHIVGGFHLSNPASGRAEADELITEVGRRLLESGAVCHTGHCTGSPALHRLKELMGDKVHPLAAGLTLKI